MGIDFLNEKNKYSYTTRNADTSWKETIKELVPVNKVKNAGDIGCGGGIYTKALADMGIGTVTGVDFSDTMLEGAKENCKDHENIRFQSGTAFATSLPKNSQDLILERALIHHLTDMESCFSEAHRVLKKGGYYIIQDRTPEDCLLAGDASHIRGYIFEVFPKLLKNEINRRHSSQRVMEKLTEAGFYQIEEVKLWETRKIYGHKQSLLEDIRKRTGRSILHELTDEELNLLINHLEQVLPEQTLIVEKDRWTVWKAVKTNI